MPYLRDPDHYTRGVGAIASIDHNRGRRNARVLVARQTQVMDRQKLAQRALGAVPARGAAGAGLGVGAPRPQRQTTFNRPPQTFSPAGARGQLQPQPQRSKYVGTQEAPPPPVSVDPNTIVIDPGPPPPRRGIVLNGGGGGGGLPTAPTPPTAPAPPDALPSFDPGPDVEQILTPDDPAPDPSSSSATPAGSDNTKWLVLGAAGLGALFLFFRKED